MEQHPVPRNITGFQFHLVGDMTLKQFGYLAGGVVSAYFIYKFPLPGILSLPLAALVALSGVAFAFLPIQERPLDRWLVAFIKSIYSPTQFIWRKENAPLPLLTQGMLRTITAIDSKHSANHQLANQKLAAYLASLPPTLEKSVNLREKAYIENTLSLFNSPGFQSDTITAPPLPVNLSPIAAPKLEKLSFKGKVTQLPTPKETAKSVPKKISPTPHQTPKAEEKPAEGKQAETLKAEALKLKEELGRQTISKERFLELEQKLNELLTEKERLTSELTDLRQKENKPTSIPVKPVVTEGKPTEPTVKSVSARAVKDLTGMPSMPTIGNIIIGVIRDNLERLLPGIIVTVKDLSGMPVRAFKTNKLGQFAAATPLTNGNYIIEIEDPQKRYQFDLIEISLNGDIFMPIEIIAKGNREIMRDKLTKEIFGNNNII